MKLLLLTYFLLAGALSAPAFTKKGTTGATISTNGSQSDVQAAINNAAAGSTVTMPSGTFDWNGQLTINKAVNLAGNETIIRNQNGSSNLIVAASAKNGNIEIYGISFKQIADNGGGRGFTINASRDESTQYTVKIHDCSFEQGTIYGYSMHVTSNGILIWSCSFVGTGLNGLGGISFEGNQQDYNSYNQPSTLGTKDPDGLHNTYVEDCEFSNATIAMANFDCNSRTVWRHNMHVDATLNSHGQETSPIGVTSWEVYDNTFKLTDPANNPMLLSYWVCIRGGTGVFTGNSLDLVPWNKSQLQLNVFSITRSANDNRGGSFCPIEYPAPRQTGWSWTNNNANWGKVEDAQNPQLLEGGRSPGYFLPNGKGAVCDPVYVWDNTGPGSTAPVFVGTQTYVPDNCGNGQVIDTYLKKGRDYIVNQGPKPGYAKYPYPHPLRTGGGPGPSPTPSPAPTPTPQPTATPNPTPNPTPTPPQGQTYRNWLDQLSNWIRQNPATPDN